MNDKESKNFEAYTKDKTFVAHLDNWGKGTVWDEAQLMLFGLQGKVLDLACGSGQITKYALDLGLDCYGCDWSNELLSLALLKGISSERLKRCSVYEMPYGENEFNYTYTIGSLEHFNNIDKAVEEIIRITQTASIHHVPISARDKDVGWVSDGTQEYHLQSLLWWIRLFVKYGCAVYVIPSKWKGEKTVGKWLIVKHNKG